MREGPYSLGLQYICSISIVVNIVTSLNLTPSIHAFFILISMSVDENSHAMDRVIINSTDEKESGEFLCWEISMHSLVPVNAIVDKEWLS